MPALLAIEDAPGLWAQLAAHVQAGLASVGTALDWAMGCCAAACAQFTAAARDITGTLAAVIQRPGAFSGTSTSAPQGHTGGDGERRAPRR